MPLSSSSLLFFFFFLFLNSTVTLFSFSFCVLSVSSILLSSPLLLQQQWNQPLFPFLVLLFPFLFYFILAFLFSLASWLLFRFCSSMSVHLCPPVIVTIAVPCAAVRLPSAVVRPPCAAVRPPFGQIAAITRPLFGQLPFLFLATTRLDGINIRVTIGRNERNEAKY